MSGTTSPSNSAKTQWCCVNACRGPWIGLLATWASTERPMNDNTSFNTSPTPALVEQVLAEQRRCWQRGERLPVEVFLARAPTLGSDKEGVLHLIFNEVVLR